MAQGEDQPVGGADEGDFLELLIANERMFEWADELQTPGNPARKREIILELDRQVATRTSYAEEAIRVGIIPILTRVLTTTRDEQLMDAISRILVACSGPMACGGKVTNYTYGRVHVRIREGALGDGLGARVWTSAHILSREIVAQPEFLAGHSVLEVGSGCGVCGIVAAKLGAQEVVLTDVEGPVLQNLQECMLLNATSAHNAARSTGICCPQLDTAHAPELQLRSLQLSEPALAAAHSSEGLDLQPSYAAQPESTASSIECTNADSSSNGCTDEHSSSNGCTDGLSTSSSVGSGSVLQAWDVDNMRVRQLDWLDSLKLMSRRGASTQHANDRLGATCPCPDTAQACADVPRSLDAKTFYANDLLRMVDDHVPLDQRPPCVPLDQQYSRIIGTDIMYEPMHAQLVAAVLAHRLAPGGAALLCCAVRQARTFETFTEECTRWGLRYRKRQAQPAREYGGIFGREEDYEGGFLLMAVDHAAHPCRSWPHDDWQS